MGKFNKPARKRGIYKRKKSGGSKFMPRGIVNYGGAGPSDITDIFAQLNVPSIIYRIMAKLKRPGLF